MGKRITINPMKVIKKQTNSHNCLICGMDNPAGAKASFYEMEDGSVVALFKFNALLQSYPERTHGGVITAMIDETIGRAIWTKEPNMWGVTMTIDVKFRKPVPYDVPLKCIGKLTRDTSMTFEGEAKIIDENKTVLAEGHAVYFKLSYEKITNHDHEHEEDKMFVVKDSVKEIEL